MSSAIKFFLLPVAIILALCFFFIVIAAGGHMYSVTLRATRSSQRVLL